MRKGRIERGEESMVQGKTIPVQAYVGLESSRSWRLPGFSDNRHVKLSRFVGYVICFYTEARERSFVVGGGDDGVVYHVFISSSCPPSQSSPS